MGLFGNKESKKDKQREFAEKLISKYSIEGMTEADREILARIASDLYGNDFFKNGMATFAKVDDQMRIFNYEGGESIKA